MKLPHVDVPKPTRWDLIALVILVLGAALAAGNLVLAAKKAPGASVSSALTTGFVCIQMAIAVAGLAVLGKTAKEGTLWGNLCALGALAVGMSGVLLAAALWAAA